MLHKNKLKIMELFFELPTKNFQLREVSRLSGIAVTSARKYLNELAKEGLVRKDNQTPYPSYVGNSVNPLFRVYKQQVIILKIFHSGLIEYLEKETLPRCIIIFGSARKGEYTTKSDIDIFVQSSGKTINLRKYEQILRHKINILFEPELNHLSNELMNNIINGVVLYGFIKL